MGPPGRQQPGQLPYPTIASRTAQEEAEERELAAARETFPGWRIVELFPGFIAVPVEATVLRAATLDSLVRKLRERE